MPEVRYMLSLLPSYSIWYLYPHVLSYSKSFAWLLYLPKISTQNNHPLTKTTTKKHKKIHCTTQQHKPFEKVFLNIHLTFLSLGMQMHVFAAVVFKKVF